MVSVRSGVLFLFNFSLKIRSQRFPLGPGADGPVEGHVHVFGEKANAAIAEHELRTTGVIAAGCFFCVAVDRVVTFSGDQVFAHLCRRVAVGAA